MTREIVGRVENGEHFPFFAKLGGIIGSAASSASSQLASLSLVIAGCVKRTAFHKRQSATSASSRDGCTGAAAAGTAAIVIHHPRAAYFNAAAVRELAAV